MAMRRMKQRKHGLDFYRKVNGNPSLKGEYGVKRNNVNRIRLVEDHGFVTVYQYSILQCRRTGAGKYDLL